MTSINTAALLYGIIETVIFLIPLAGLIWKAATLASRISKAEADIKEIKPVIEKQNDAILKTLNQLTETVQELKVEVAVIKAKMCNDIAKASKTEKAKDD